MLTFLWLDISYVSVPNGKGVSWINIGASKRKGTYILRVANSVCHTSKKQQLN